MKVHPALAAASSPAWSEASADEGVGVDFLGTRAANLEMLTRLTGPYNNVAVSARQHAILCWAAWRYRESCRAHGRDPSPGQCRDFFDAVETIQLAGQRQIGIGVGGSDRGLGANSAERLGDGPTIPLRFVAYGRSHQTSAFAAVQYGPSAKTRSLGLLDVAGGVWAPTARGVEIARALDALLVPSPAYAKLASLPIPDEIALVDAIDLASRGLVIGAALSARPERAPYLRALFDLDGYVARDHERRLSFALVLELVDRIGCGAGVTPRQIRLAMLSSHTASGPLAIPDHLRPTAERWQLFQLRQLQRYVLEAWLYLVEWNMLVGPHSARSFADDFAHLTGKRDAGLARLLECPVGEIVPAHLEDRGIADVAAWSTTDAAGTPWGMYVEIRDALAEQDRGRAIVATLNLTIAVLALAGALVDNDNAFAAIGGRRRISLVHFKHWWERRYEMKLLRALEDMLEELVLQQHVAVAVSRFDNEKRRLRFSNDECGWEALPGTLPSKPSRTPDRILAMLSLLSDLALVAQVDERFTVTNAGRDLLRVMQG